MPSIEKFDDHMGREARANIFNECDPYVVSSFYFGPEGFLARIYRTGFGETSEFDWVWTVW
jgi:hypothetical protein